jgi:hypothetical protein
MLLRVFQEQIAFQCQAVVVGAHDPENAMVTKTVDEYGSVTSVTHVSTR